MALYYDLPVFKEAYQLTLSLFQLTAHFPREYKFTIGQDVKRDCIQLCATWTASVSRLLHGAMQAHKRHECAAYTARCSARISDTFA